MSKKSILFLFLALGLMSMNRNSNHVSLNKEIFVSEKFDIKIKNDLADEVNVINAGSGGSYRLIKNGTTTIKMEEGDKLHYYEKGKKGNLILTATKEMHGKVQLLSKL